MKRNTGKAISEAEFRRMWMDESLSQNEIGRRLGVTGSAVRFRAKIRGLPDRASARMFARKFDHDRAVRLYRAGLALHVVAGMLGCTSSVVRHALGKAGVVIRGRHDPRAVTAAEFATMAMQASAKETAEAMRLSEMVDGFQHGRWAKVAA